MKELSLSHIYSKKENFLYERKYSLFKISLLIESKVKKKSIYTRPIYLFYGALVIDKSLLS